MDSVRARQLIAQYGNGTPLGLVLAEELDRPGPFSAGELIAFARQRHAAQAARRGPTASSPTSRRMRAAPIRLPESEADLRPSRRSVSGDIRPATDRALAEHHQRADRVIRAFQATHAALRAKVERQEAATEAAVRLRAWNRTNRN